MKAAPCPVSADELHDIYTQRKLTDQEIAGLLGATAKQVRAWRVRFGIVTLDRSARHDVPPIEGPLQSLLVGSMLGDGRLARNPHTARYMENHADAQKVYLDWKRQQWGTWAKNELSPVSWAHQGKTYRGWRFETVSHAALLPWHALFYPTVGPKQLQDRVVELVDSRAFAIWFMDDGSTGWWPRITFGMNLASRGVAWGIFEKFGFAPRWEMVKGKTGVFHITGEPQAERFIEMVKPHMPECMYYKLSFGFQGRGYRIRQASPEAKLQDLASQGVPIRQMADRLGLSASVVSRRLIQLGIEHPRRVGRPPSS